MAYTISCRCGQLQGELDASAAKRSNHFRCYCTDCQAFANALEDPAGTLDDQGGTEILQVSAAALRITAGHEHLACLKLTKRGLGRWYASCCNSPLGNSPGLSLPFIGLIHRALPGVDLDQTFGPADLCFFPKSASGEPKPKGTSPILGILRSVKLALAAKLAGASKQHPFYSLEGDPIATPKVLGE